MPTNFSIPANNYQALVTQPRSVAGTSLHVSTTAGLPTLTGSQYLRMSVFRNQVPVVILKVTAVDSVNHVLTVAGALEGSDASVNTGDNIAICDTAGVFSDIQAAINSIESGQTLLPVKATNSNIYRNLNDRFGEVFNVLDWGAKGDGVTDDAPAINALFVYIAQNSATSATPRTVYFPAGNYILNSSLLLAKRIDGVSPPGTQLGGIHLIGQGYSSQLVAENIFGITEILRMEDCAACRVEGLRLLCAQPVTVAALHVTAVTSGENNTFRDIYVECSNKCPVGIAVCIDNDVDVSQIQFHECSVADSTKAGYMLGNGISGNVLDIRFHDCLALHNYVGVWMDAAPAIWTSGVTTYSTISDFFVSAGMGGPIVIEHVRSENSNMLFLSRGGGPIPPIRISDVQCSGFIGQTYNYDDPTQTFSSVGEVVEGFVISHRYDGVLTIMNCSFWHGPVNYPGGRLNVASDCHVTVINCELGAAGSTATALRGALYSSGGVSGKLNFTALGGKTVTTGGTGFQSPIDILCDGPAFFNNTVAINTMAPTAGFHQVGGSFYLQKIPDPTLAPTVTNTGGGSTSYTYYYSYVDEVGNNTLVSPGGTVTGAATLDDTHYNTITIPNPGVNIASVDILRGATNRSVITGFDPYVSSPAWTYVDKSAGTSPYVTPTRNATADITIDGTINLNDASNFGVLSTGSTTIRTLAQRFTNQWYNVLDWGVTGNGVTDDQPAIMALLQYVSNLSSNTGFRRTIFFPAGSYNIGSATNSQGIMVAKRLMQKGDGSYPAAGTSWAGINLIGEGYSTQFISNCPTGLTEIMRLEDTGITRVQGFRFWVHPGMPVTTAAFHITAIKSGENHITEDVVVEIQPYGPFTVTVLNGSTNVTGSGTSWDQTFVGKYLLFAGDTTHAAYQISAVGNATTITLAGAYGGTTGSTTATIKGGGCPVGIGVSVDYNNDTAQLEFVNCKVSGASYAGWMIGGGVQGNVLDIRCWGCQSLNNAIGVFCWDAPIVWQSGVVTFNYIADFYHNGAAQGPVLIENVRSEGSNQFYKNNGGGTSLSPTTISNCTITGWSGFTYAVALNGAPPFYPMAVSITNGSPTVTGTNTFFTSGPVIVGTNVIFQSDSTATVYTVLSIASDTSLTLSTNYAGTTNATTFMGISAPVFTLNTQAGLTGTTIVTTTNGSAVVTGVSSWTGSLTTSMYLVFANDPNQYAYSIKTIDSTTQVTLNTNSKGNTTYIGPTGLTTVKCGLVEGYGLVNRCGGVFNLMGLVFQHSPTPYGYARFNFSATDCFVTAIGCTAGAASSTQVGVRDANFFGGGVNPSGTNFMVLPGPAITSGNSLASTPLGFMCNYQANFSQPIAVGAFNIAPTAGYHQQGGSMLLQSIPDPSPAPSVSVQGSAGSTNYYYKYVFRDQAGNVTLYSPSSSLVSTSQPFGSFTTVNYNKISITVTYGTSNPSYVDILRSTDNATWTNVIHSTVSGSVLFGSTYTWNPWITNAMNTSTIVFNDQSTTTPTAYTLPTRNTTADIVIGGQLQTNGGSGGVTLQATYPGSAGGETNGAQTATGSWTATEQSMLQTVYNLCRSMKLLA